MKQEIEREYSAEVLWVKRNKEYLSINAIEQATGIGKNTLWYFVKGERHLADHHCITLQKWVKKLVKDSGEGK